MKTKSAAIGKVEKASVIARWNCGGYTGVVIALVAALGLMLQPDSDSHPNQTVDASTLHKKVLVGYQGWFRAGGDGGTEWDHWNRDWSTPPKTNALDMITFDMRCCR